MEHEQSRLRDFASAVALVIFNNDMSLLNDPRELHALLPDGLKNPHSVEEFVKAWHNQYKVKVESALIRLDRANIVGLLK